jgi:rod shape-determining protein MreD
MANWLSLPLLALASVLQVSFVPQLRILNGIPDLVLLIVLSWSLNTTLEDGVIWAFVGGICKDLLSAAPLGTSVVGMVIVVFGIHAIREQIYSVGLFTLIWSTLLGTTFQQFTVLVILLLAGYGPAFGDRLGYGIVLDSITSIILPTVFYNLLLILPVYGFVRRIQQRAERNKRSYS